VRYLTVEEVNANHARQLGRVPAPALDLHKCITCGHYAQLDHARQCETCGDLHEKAR
jgi:hypothetical protein